MQIPQEFRYLTTCFYAHDVDTHATVQEWLQATAEGFLSDPQRANVRSFLNELLEGNVTDDDLLGLWAGMDSDLSFANGKGLRAFLEVLKVAM